MALPPKVAIAFTEEDLPALQSMIAHPQMLTMLIAGLIEETTETPHDREKQIQRSIALSRARDTFIQQIAPKLKKLGLKLGTIGKVTPATDVLLEQAHRLQGHEQMVWLVQ